MAPINTMSVLAFATAAFAVPFAGHSHGHAKYHNNKPSGFSAYPYPSANGTGIYPTGSGFATGTEAPVAPVSETAVVSDVETTIATQTTIADASTTCTSDVTVTQTVKKTVTITPSADASSEAAPVESSSSAEAVVSSSESSAPAYSEAPTSYSSKAEAVTHETESAPAAYSSPATTSSASATSEESSAPTLTYSAANKNIDVNAGSYGDASSSSAAPSSTGSSSSSGKSGKRGVAYNDAKLTDCLVDSPAVSWGYNWGSSSSGLSDSVKFVPTLWGPASEFTNDWSDNAKAAIKSGSTHLFSFNEPDLDEQANMSPQEAATAYKKYMEPFAGDAKLCAPSVTNGAGSMGLNWLSSFLDACSDCTINCINIHWYDSAENVEYFKKHVNDASDLLSDDQQIFISEFAATGSDDQISSFLDKVMPWMDDNDKVGGYAYFMAGEGKLVSGSEQSAIGKTYASS